MIMSNNKSNTDTEIIFKIRRIFNAEIKLILVFALLFQYSWYLKNICQFSFGIKFKIFLVHHYEQNIQTKSAFLKATPYWSS